MFRRTTNHLTRCFRQKSELRKGKKGTEIPYMKLDHALSSAFYQFCESLLHNCLLQNTAFLLYLAFIIDINNNKGLTHFVFFLLTKLSTYTLTRSAVISAS